MDVETESIPILSPGKRVLHVVGRVTDSVIHLLGPGTTSLLQKGVAQTVVLLDEDQSRLLVVRLTEQVELIPVPTSRLAFRHWLDVRREVRRIIHEQPLLAIHFHGVLPWLFGVGLVNGGQVTVCLTPHESRARHRWWPLLLSMARLSRSLSRRSMKIGMFNSPLGLKGASWLDSPPLLIEGMVNDAFFNAARKEAARPQIVSGGFGYDHRAVDAFCSIAVVFSERELDLAFSWAGPLTASSADRLHAAGVETQAVSDDSVLTERLSAAWVFIACADEPGFPLPLAQAMAAGMACLVADCPAHRALIRDGETGLIYQSPEHAHQLLPGLIDDASLRQRLGQAARCEALKRFSRERFDKGLRSLYLAHVAT